MRLLTLVATFCVASIAPLLTWLAGAAALDRLRSIMTLACENRVRRPCGAITPEIETLQIEIIVASGALFLMLVGALYILRRELEARTDALAEPRGLSGPAI